MPGRIGAEGRQCRRPDRGLGQCKGNARDAVASRQGCDGPGAEKTRWAKPGIHRDRHSGRHERVRQPPVFLQREAVGHAGDEIADLAARVAQANEDYHTRDAPVLSDAEYDALKQRLLALEQAFPQLARPDSPTQAVGGAVAEGFGKVTHAQRMMSLENGFSPEDVTDFVARVRSFLGLRDGDLTPNTAVGFGG